MKRKRKNPGRPPWTLKSNTTAATLKRWEKQKTKALKDTSRAEKHDGSLFERTMDGTIWLSATEAQRAETIKEYYAGWAARLVGMQGPPK